MSKTVPPKPTLPESVNALQLALLVLHDDYIIKKRLWETLGRPNKLRPSYDWRQIERRAFAITDKWCRQFADSTVRVSDVLPNSYSVTISRVRQHESKEVEKYELVFTSRPSKVLTSGTYEKVVMQVWNADRGYPWHFDKQVYKCHVYKTPGTKYEFTKEEIVE